MVDNRPTTQLNGAGRDMRTLTLDTDSTDVSPSPLEIKFGHADRKANITYGTYADPGSPDIGFEIGSLESALRLGVGLEDHALAATIRELLNVIVESLEAYKQIARELPPLPVLHVYKIEDGSLLLEWTDDRYRIGFGVGPTAVDSSWYLVSDESLGSFNASGLLTTDNTRAITFSLVSFVLSNS